MTDTRLTELDGFRARWMVRFRFDDQDFFEVDPVRYADALGDLGLAAYRREVKQRVARHPSRLGSGTPAVGAPGRGP